MDSDGTTRMAGVYAPLERTAGRAARVGRRTSVAEACRSGSSCRSSSAQSMHFGGTLRGVVQDGVVQDGVVQDGVVQHGVVQHDRGTLCGGGPLQQELPH